VAAGATVYLPVKHGAERDALELLPESKEAAHRIAGEFTTFRNSMYGPAGPSNRVFEDPLAPTLPQVTPAGQNAWQTDWEATQRNFHVLAQWAEIVPTDGVHMETHLSESVVADERAVARLSRLDDLSSV
jgi:hypothetical protein